MVTVIYGAPETGKSTKAREVTKGKKAVWFHEKGLTGPFAFSQVEKDTEFLVIEEAENIDLCKSIAALDEIVIEKQCKIPFGMKRPHLIIVTTSILLFSMIKADNYYNLNP